VLLGKCRRLILVARSDSLNNDLGVLRSRNDQRHGPVLKTELIMSVMRTNYDANLVSNYQNWMSERTYAILAAPSIPNFKAFSVFVGPGGGLTAIR